MAEGFKFMITHTTFWGMRNALLAEDLNLIKATGQLQKDGEE